MQIEWLKGNLCFMGRLLQNADLLEELQSFRPTLKFIAAPADVLFADVLTRFLDFILFVSTLVRQV
jgi:hypothetical protein